MAQESVELTMDAESVRRTVQEYYGARARSASSCCAPSSPAGGSSASGCGNGSDCCSEGDAAALYEASELAGLPEEVANFSLGCGNPTAIAALKPGEVVVDLGSGGGLDVFLAARQVGPSGFVYGIDMTDDMLALARRNAAKLGIPNVEFRKGHIEDLPLPDATVDVILSNCVINLSPDKGQTLHEAFRVLRPGGRLAVSDIVIDGTWADLPVSEAQVRTALSWAGCIAGALTVEQYRTLLAEAGFSDIQIEIRHRYRLEDLGQNQEEVMEVLPPDVIHQLVGRFASASITAHKAPAQAA
ncbi:MAG TPA: arsenite methyltransferase [Caldilineaceae bacterium]|nr:arsenite methyltransferase [Caldilineaceae bacterium]